MAVRPANLQMHLSGGNLNDDPGRSLGGPRAFAVIDSQPLFADVPSAEAAKGSVTYRCVYFRNADRDALQSPQVWIDAVGDGTLAVGLGGHKNAIAMAIADERTTPPGVSFAALGARVALPQPPYQAGETVAIWLRRTIAPGSAPGWRSDSLHVEGDSV